MGEHFKELLVEGVEFIVDVMGGGAIASSWEGSCENC